MGCALISVPVKFCIVFFSFLLQWNKKLEMGFGVLGEFCCIKASVGRAGLRLYQVGERRINDRSS